MRWEEYQILIAGCPTLVALFATEPALSEVEGVGILTSDHSTEWPILISPLFGEIRVGILTSTTVAWSLAAASPALAPAPAPEPAWP
jgi:hypothetical protein